MRRTLLGLAITGAAVVGALGGCGTNDDDTVAQGRSAQAKTTSSVDTEATESPQPEPFDAERFISWDLEHPDGNEARVMVEIGAPVLPADAGGLPSGLESLADICSVDAERDVFVPLRVSATNLTYEFSTTPSVRISNPFGSSAFADNTRPIELATRYLDGETACRNQTDSMFEQWLSVKFELLPSETRRLDALAVLRDYRTPAAPNGDPEAFTKAAGWVEVFESGDWTRGYKPTCVETNANNVWTGEWTGMPRAQFALLNVAPHGFMAAEDMELPRC